MAKSTKASGSQTELFSNDSDFLEADRRATSRQLRQDSIVAQHNDLIRARYEMSLLESRLFICLLGRIDRKDKDFLLCRIPVSELYPDEKVGGKAYAQVREAVIRLASRVIHVESIDENGRREIVSNPLMATCRYKEGSGYLIAQFNNFVKPYLLELQGNFTVAEIQTLLGFRSFYSYRLYWLLKSAAFHHETIKLELSSLKKTLNLEQRYQNFADFKRFVLDIAKHELSITDMAFDYKQLKDGRAVTALSFHLLRPAVVTQDDIKLPEGTQQTLTEVGLSLKSLSDIKLRFQQGGLPEDYLRFVIHYYQEAKKKGRLKSLAGAIYKALMTDQLRQEFQLWQANQPTYHAPKATHKTAKVEIIPLDVLREQFESLSTKGLAEYDTFEAYLDWMLSQAMYDMDVIDGKEVLVYTEPATDIPKA
ncbi:replication initiation protein [Spirosoma oryzicola]|uniref:replication initiation protein n=1 Tax=Spirosoma oryzicola TaxID=2898794 RepID=UPI001E2B2099|nr:replication initiation protein [Spirosoma oryzicola]UHG93855.1 replication initiation protein [Spirosoma oryzicola]